MKEINRRIEFDHPDAPVIFMNINLKRSHGEYKFQCLLKDQEALYDFCATVHEPDLNRIEAESWIDYLTEEAFLYFEELLYGE